MQNKYMLVKRDVFDALTRSVDDLREEVNCLLALVFGFDEDSYHIDDVREHFKRNAPIYWSKKHRTGDGGGAIGALGISPDMSETDIALARDTGAHLKLKEKIVVIGTTVQQAIYMIKLPPDDTEAVSRAEKNMNDGLYGYCCQRCGHVIAYHNAAIGAFPNFERCDVCGAAADSHDMKNWEAIKKG